MVYSPQFHCAQALHGTEVARTVSRSIYSHRGYLDIRNIGVSYKISEITLLSPWAVAIVSPDPGRVILKIMDLIARDLTLPLISCVARGLQRNASPSQMGAPW